MAKQKNLISITLFFFVWVLLLQFIAFFAENRIAFLPDQSYEGLKYDERLLREGGWPEKWWQRYDSNWYLSIASRGYFYNDGEQSNVVFFPLYPLLIRIAAPFVGGNQPLAGILISMICAFLACIFIYKLAELEWGTKTAARAAYFFLLFPVSFYLISIYTESLFLALSLAAFYCCRTKRWFLAIIFGIALTATRITGLAILVAFGIELFHQRKHMPQKLFFSRALCLCVIPLGFFIFAFAMLIQFGDPFVIFKGQGAWQRNFDPVPSSILSSLQNYLDEFALVANPNNPQPLFTRYIDVAFFLLFVAAIIIAWLKMPPSYAIFATLLLIIPLISGRLQSIPRYMLSAFPVFFACALVARTQLAVMSLFALFTLFLALFTAMFVHFYWIA